MHIIAATLTRLQLATLISMPHSMGIPDWLKQIKNAGGTRTAKGLMRGSDWKAATHHRHNMACVGLTRP